MDIIDWITTEAANPSQSNRLNALFEKNAVAVRFDYDGTEWPD